MEENKEWAHFIGTRYSPQSFLAEAKLFNVSRNLPSSQLKGINFGDIVNLLQWDGENEEALLFAQFTVNRILIRDAEISSKVSQRLIEEGRARPSNESSSGGGGESVIRECGEYNITGRTIVDDEFVTISEMVTMAECLARELGRKVSFMVGGYISNEFPKPVKLGVAGPKFSRGFIKFETGATFSKTEKEIISVSDYHGSTSGE